MRQPRTRQGGARRPGTRRLTSTLTAVVALSVAGVACGGDDGGGRGGSLQTRVADQLIAEANADGMGLDESCVRRVTGELSDSDARALLDDDEDALSETGGMALLGLFECLDFGDLDFDFDLDD